MKKLVYNSLPDCIKSILIISDGWLVGSAVEKLLAKEDPKDYDIIIPSRENYQVTSTAIKSYLKGVNTFGGLKYEFPDGIVVDMWPEELDHYLASASTRLSIYKLRGGILLQHAV